MGKVIRKVRCPNPDHQDNRPSAAMYEDGGIHCFVCSYHKRGENEEPYQHRSNYVAQLEVGYSTGEYEHKPLPKQLARTYAHWLERTYGTKRDWLLSRGISESVIRSAGLGYTGSLYTIPIYELPRHSIHLGYSYATLTNIRFRTDDDLSDHKQYFGVSGRNKPQLFLLQEHLHGRRLRSTDEFALPDRLVVTEGELDVLVAESHGYSACTMTCGAKALQRYLVPSLLRLGFSGRLVMCGDTDEIGLETQRLVAHQAMGAGLRVSVTSNHYKDIGDTYLSEGKEGVVGVLEATMPLFNDTDIDKFYQGKSSKLQSS